MADQLLVPRELLERLDFGKDTARALQALPELRDLLAQPASAPKPVEDAVGIVDESDDGIFIDLIYGENGNPLKRGDLVFTHPAPAGVVPAAGQWREGAPPHPWDSEWFLAKMSQGQFVVLRPLPKEYTYDFTTADGTYVMRKSIVKWAQLSGSEYVEPEACREETARINGAPK